MLSEDHINDYDTFGDAIAAVEAADRLGLGYTLVRREQWVNGLLSGGYVAIWTLTLRAWPEVDDSARPLDDEPAPAPAHEAPAAER